MNTDGRIYLLPGFTDEAFRELVVGAYVVLVHTWRKGWGSPELDGQLVKSPVRIKESNGGDLLVAAEGGQPYRVPRADVWAWKVVPAGKTPTTVPPIVRALPFLTSPWTPTGLRA